MNYPLHMQKKGNYLKPQNNYYSDEYTQRMFDLYLTVEIAMNEEGKPQRFYRLHAKHDHTQEMALAYDIRCPKCSSNLKQIGRQISSKTLGFYTCPECNRRGGIYYEYEKLYGYYSATGVRCPVLELCKGKERK